MKHRRLTLQDILNRDRGGRRVTEASEGLRNAARTLDQGAEALLRLRTGTRGQ